VVQIRKEFRFPHEGPPPAVCSCGKLSLRHAVEFHDSECGYVATWTNRAIIGVTCSGASS
jgi:hypothetical protein